MQIDQPSVQMRLVCDDLLWESTYFDEIESLFYEGGPVLRHRDVEGSYLSMNIGVSLPLGWQPRMLNVLCAPRRHLVTRDAFNL